MKIGILSDTHDQMKLIEQAVEIFNKREVGMVVHCGDWVSPFALIPFKNLKCPLRSVFGNNDGDKFRHLIVAGKLDLDILQEERFIELEVEGRKIAIFHGDYIEIVHALAKCGKYDAVFYGHNHELKAEMENDTIVVNPGGFIKAGDPSYRPSVAIYNSESNTAEHLFL